MPLPSRGPDQGSGNVARSGAELRARLDVVAPSNLVNAFELLWRLFGYAGGVLTRADDGSGCLSEALRAAAQDFGPLAERVNLSSVVLVGDDHGQLHPAASRGRTWRHR
ncbi:DUF6880 family protein [Roseomonas sp. WA12]